MFQNRPPENVIIFFFKSLFMWKWHSITKFQVTNHHRTHKGSNTYNIVQKTRALWKHGLTSTNTQSQLPYFCKSNINQPVTNSGGMIWGVRIAIFTEIRHLVEELITFLSIFWTLEIEHFDRLSESFSISTSIQWDGIGVLKHAQNLHSYCENNSFRKALMGHVESDF